MRYLMTCFFALAFCCGCASDDPEPKEIHFGPGPDGKAQDKPIGDKDR